MAAKKKSEGRVVSKTQFVTGLPSSLSADEVVAKAKEQGIEISKMYVHTIRSKAKISKRRKSRAPRATVLPARPAQAAAPRASSGLDAQFANIVAEIGLTRAEELLRSVRAKFTAAAR
jgi:hypothetical protein